jgi:hypothetical protein
MHVKAPAGAAVSSDMQADAWQTIHITECLTRSMAPSWPSTEKKLTSSAAPIAASTVQATSTGSNIYYSTALNPEWRRIFCRNLAGALSVAATAASGYAAM